MSNVDQHAIAATGAAAILASLMNWAPPIAALLAALWYVVQIWESDTVKGWRAAIKQRRESRKRVIAALVVEREAKRQQAALTLPPDAD